MTAQEAFNQLNPGKWKTTTITERLQLLEAVRGNMKVYARELAASDAKMKNDLIGADLYTITASMLNTILPIGNAVTASIHLYEALAKGEMPKGLEVTKVKNDLYDILVFPQKAKDKILSGTQKGHLRVKGTPVQVNPLDKPAGIIAVLGAGNYSSSLEMVKALFWENKAVIHKPHPLNEGTDAVWAKIFKPLVDWGALSFCPADQGQALTMLKGLTNIYFTGSTATAKAIMKATDIPLVAECGGNNPGIVVPGDRPWTKKEIQHQANQIATAAKFNGGAICGRPQTLVTTRHWPQREEFLTALRKAIVEDTPATGTYYPGSIEVAATFKKAYPNAEVLEPEGGKYKKGEFLFIAGIGEEGFALKKEAFCQLLDEVPLDIPARADEFLPAAVRFCNEKLLGTLCCMIVIDEHTQKTHQGTLEQAITDLEYGGIAVNTVPPLIFTNPYLTWGGLETGKVFVSGNGNFGNLLCYKNIEKSILYDQFMSPGHIIMTNKQAFEHIASNMAKYAMAPTWMNLTKMIGMAVIDSFKGKDF